MGGACRRSCDGLWLQCVALHNTLSQLPLTCAGGKDAEVDAPMDVEVETELAAGSAEVRAVRQADRLWGGGGGGVSRGCGADPEPTRS